MASFQNKKNSDESSKESKSNIFKTLYHSEIVRIRIPVVTGVVLLFLAIIEFSISRIESSQTHIYSSWFGLNVSGLIQESNMHMVNSIILLLIALILFYSAYRYYKNT